MFNPSTLSQLAVQNMKSTPECTILVGKIQKYPISLAACGRAIAYRHN